MRQRVSGRQEARAHRQADGRPGAHAVARGQRPHAETRRPARRRQGPDRGGAPAGREPWWRDRDPECRIRRRRRDRGLCPVAERQPDPARPAAAAALVRLAARAGHQAPARYRRPVRDHDRDARGGGGARPGDRSGRDHAPTRSQRARLGDARGRDRDRARPCRPPLSAACQSVPDLPDGGPAGRDPVRALAVGLCQPAELRCLQFLLHRALPHLQRHAPRRPADGGPVPRGRRDRRQSGGAAQGPGRSHAHDRQTHRQSLRLQPQDRGRRGARRRALGGGPSRRLDPSVPLARPFAARRSARDRRGLPAGGPDLRDRPGGGAVDLGARPAGRLELGHPACLGMAVPAAQDRPWPAGPPGHLVRGPQAAIDRGAAAPAGSAGRPGGGRDRAHPSGAATSRTRGS